MQVWGTAIIEEKEDCVALGSVTVKQYKDPEIRKKIGLLLCEKWDTGANKNTGEVRVAQIAQLTCTCPYLPANQRQQSPVSVP